MTAKEYLKQARKLDIRLKALEESKRRAYERATSAVAPIRDGYVHNSTPASPIDKYSELSDEVDRQEKALNEKKAEITAVIGQVRDNILATLLTEYYVNGRTWNEVAEKINYSSAHTTKDLHPRALRAVDNILKNPK